MATIWEYFNSDVKVFSCHGPWKFQAGTGSSFEVTARLALDIEGNAKYWYFYVPRAEAPLGDMLGAIFTHKMFEDCQVSPDGNFFELATGLGDDAHLLTTETLVFTKRIHLYVDYDLEKADRKALIAQLRDRGYFLSVRDNNWAKERSLYEKPLAFISHDSRDKEVFVSDLAVQLLALRCSVWYDEFSLKIGDSLRANIERGLKETKKCIVVLSDKFMNNAGWGRAEFDSIFTREILEQTNVILPVWLGTDKNKVYEFSPRMADRLGVDANLGAKEVARRLLPSITGNAAPLEITMTPSE